jgi:hypothetical protein
MLEACKQLGSNPTGTSRFHALLDEAVVDVVPGAHQHAPDGLAVQTEHRRYEPGRHSCCWLCPLVMPLVDAAPAAAATNQPAVAHHRTTGHACRRCARSGRGAPDVLTFNTSSLWHTFACCERRTRPFAACWRAGSGFPLGTRCEGQHVQVLVGGVPEQLCMLCERRQQQQDGAIRQLIPSAGKPRTISHSAAAG